MTEDELRRAIDALRATTDQLVAQLVRRDVYDSDQRGVNASIKVVADDVDKLERRQNKTEEQRAADKRLLGAAFISPLILLLIQLYLHSQGLA